MTEKDVVSVRYMVSDVEESIDFYTRHLGFTLRHSALPAFADVVRGRLRLLLAGPKSSAGRPMPNGRKAEPGGWNRIHLGHHSPSFRLNTEVYLLEGEEAPALDLGEVTRSPGNVTPSGVRHDLAHVGGV